MVFVVCVCVAECGCLRWGYGFYPTLLHRWQNPNVAGQNKKEDLSVNIPSETRTRCHILYTRYFKAWFCLKPGIRLLCSAVCSSTLVLIESWIICFIRSRLQSLCDVNFLLYTSKFAFVRLCKKKTTTGCCYDFFRPLSQRSQIFWPQLRCWGVLWGPAMLTSSRTLLHIKIIQHVTIHTFRWMIGSSLWLWHWRLW